jgi:hypothetical protein
MLSVSRDRTDLREIELLHSAGNGDYRLHYVPPAGGAVDVA